MKEKKDKWTNRVALYAIVYFILLIILYIVLVSILKVSENTVTSVGQLLADWLLLPTVIFGFWLAIREFRESQVRPILKIFWSWDRGVLQDGNCLILETSEHSMRRYQLLLHVSNKSEIFVIWYRITVDLPRELVGWGDNRYELRWHLGEEGNWGSNVNMERIQHEFKSNGYHALYPGQQVHIATLEIQGFPNDTSINGKIRFSIVTDKTKDAGEQEVRIEREDFQRRLRLDPSIKRLDA